ncbi:endonuclease/exonuclease/phosphatase family protein [Halalkalibacter krulwichiae]|uniref:Maltose 6'-phosphate phosphatase n=1 Tax=Halalkalibacter krulwichiae TaxID=199441 RepID=A0A1Y9THD4_9BACI|nr:endonuclease/exonuclease/phosphatase family protein [Halalkalibacter krulwichiae]ARK28578.1 Maltose 6'-phosphate phosphatase [Halalkalibacter krulwichiae]
MKLLTLNCHSWQEDNQIEKIKWIAEAIKENSYDVIALQEVSQLITGEVVNGSLKKDNYVFVLLDELRKLGVTNYNFFWDFAHIGFEVYEEGLAILTKHKIEKKHSFFVSQSNDNNNWKTRKIVGATIQYKGRSVSLYSCHLGWWHDEEEPFKKQMDSLSTNLNQDEIVFLMGDFNNAAHLKDEGYEYVLKNGFYDTFALAQQKDEGITVEGKIAGWEKNKQNLRIDYIFSNKQLAVHTSKVIFNGKNKPIVSDHFGLEVKVSL